MNALPGVAAECRYRDPEAMFADLGALVARTLRRAVDTRGRASLVVSGGSTPAPLFDRLSSSVLEWSRVSVTLADERWVPLQHSDSNEAMVRQRLISGEAAAAQFTSLYEPDTALREAAGIVSERVRDMPQPFDVVLLGMGNDGHTASLFPGDPQLAAALEASQPACVSMSPPADPRGRMSLNLAALLNSRRIVLLITGEEKWRLYQDIAAHQGNDTAHRWPVATVLSQRQVPVSVWWAA